MTLKPVPGEVHFDASCAKYTIVYSSIGFGHVSTLKYKAVEDSSVYTQTTREDMVDTACAVRCFDGQPMFGNQRGWMHAHQRATNELPDGITLT